MRNPKAAFMWVVHYKGTAREKSKLFLGVASGIREREDAVRAGKKRK